MRAQLIELTPDSRTRSRKAWWLNIAFTSAWQSSKVPSMATRVDVASSGASSSCAAAPRRCGPAGTARRRSTCARPRNASTAAPPVSPEVATDDGGALAALLQHVVHQPRQQLHRQVLEGERRAVEQLEHEQVGPSLRRAAPPPDGGRCRRPRCAMRARSASAMVAADERPDHLDRDLGIGPPGEAGDRSRRRASARSRAHRGRRRGPGPRASPRRNRAAAASPRVET